MAKTIVLTRGKTAVVDDKNYEELNSHKWYAAKVKNGRFYAQRKVNGKIIFMHRVVANAPLGVRVDHKNNDGLDNQEDNLRFCTNSQNQHNKGVYSNNTSGYKGVCWHVHARKWQARITLNGQTQYLGTYNTAVEAATVYDTKARELFGEFARTNFQTV